MKVLLINTSERTGGAAIAAGRLMNALQRKGIDAQLLVGRKTTNFLYERVVIWLNNLFSRKNLFKVSIANAGTDITALPQFREADVIHLHWINQGMLSVGGLKKILQSGKKVVWTLHDMWPCTGICHHAYTCTRYEQACGNCPFLRFPRKHDLSHRVWKQKQNAYNVQPFRVVAVSSWLAAKVKSSNLLGNHPVAVIPNTLSAELFRIKDKSECRKELNLCADRYTIAFGAARLNDPIKGLSLLEEALHYLVNNKIIESQRLQVLLFGGWKGSLEQMQRIPVAYSYRPNVPPEELSTLYSAADVVVSSSLYETFGQTLIEAQACGCVPVSFDNSGQTDIIRHKQNGYLARYLSVEDLAEGIRWAAVEAPKVLSAEERRAEVLERFSEEGVAEQYIELYKNL